VKSIDPEMIASLLEQDDKEKADNAAKRIKKGKVVTEPRKYEVWFALPSHFGPCSNPHCVDPRDNLVGKAMVAEVNGSDICRYCFLAGVNKSSVS